MTDITNDEVFSDYHYCEALKTADLPPDASRWITMYALALVHTLTKKYDDNEHADLRYKYDKNDVHFGYFKQQLPERFPDIEPSRGLELLNAQIGHYVTHVLDLDRDWAEETAAMHRNSDRLDNRPTPAIVPREKPQKRDPLIPDGTSFGKGTDD